MRHSFHADRSAVHAAWPKAIVSRGLINWTRTAACLLALLMSALPVAASAQTVPNLRIPPITLPDPDESLRPGDKLPDLELPDVQISETRNVIVDTDPGVDDAAALIWLLSQQRYSINPLGIVTVAGNTSVDNATNNVLLLLDWLDRTDIPVVKGAKKPSRRLLSRVGAPIHGPDGLWFLSTPQDQSGVAKNAAAFYCNTLAAEPNTLIITLGPLTNLAEAINRCKNAWQEVEIVSVGGARVGGNQTSVTEYNYWQDPEAADFVLANAPAYGYTVQMMPFDAFSQFTLRAEDLGLLARNGIPAIQQLLPAIEFYAGSLALNGEPLTLPDVAGTLYALDNRLGDPQQALVKVLSHPAVPGYARGQTIVGLADPEKLSMIATDEQLNELADLAVELILGQITPEEFQAAYDAILFSEPDNAAFVANIHQVDMLVAFLIVLTADSASNVDGNLEDTGTGVNVPAYQLYVPLID